MFLPHLGNVKNYFQLRVECGCCDRGPSDGVYYKIVVYADCTTCHYLMLKNYFNPIYLRWVILLQEFEFDVHDKGGIRAIKPPSPSVFPLSKR